MNADLRPTVTRRWKAIGLLCLVFILGAVTGIGGGALILRHVIQSRISAGITGVPLLDRAERAILSNPDLTNAEREAIKVEFAVTRSRIIESRKNMLSELRETAEDTLNRIKTHLPAGKQDLLDQQARKQLAPWGMLQEEKKTSAHSP